MYIPKIKGLGDILHGSILSSAVHTPYLEDHTNNSFSIALIRYVFDTVELYSPVKYINCKKLFKVIPGNSLKEFKVELEHPNLSMICRYKNIIVTCSDFRNEKSMNQKEDNGFYVIATNLGSGDRNNTNYIFSCHIDIKGTPMLTKQFNLYKGDYEK